MPERHYNPTDAIRLNVYDTECGTDEIFHLVQSVLECLNPLQGTDHQLRQLWIETQWLKTTARDGKLILPNAFDMMIFQMARGHHSIMNRFPLLKQRVVALADALESVIEA